MTQTKVVDMTKNVFEQKRNMKHNKLTCINTINYTLVAAHKNGEQLLRLNIAVIVRLEYFLDTKQQNINTLRSEIL